MNHPIPTGALLALLLALLSWSAQAAPEVGSGSLLIPAADGTTPIAAPVLNTEVSIRVVAMSARVTVAQTFRNPGARWTEGIYVFPLPDDAAVDRLRMRVGERVIEGDIQPKDEARKTYQTARAAGQRSSLVEQQRPNIFTTSVANIDPNGEIRVEIEYQQSVAWRDGDFSLRFPMVVAPRYIPGQPIAEQISLSGGWSPDTDQVPDASRITPPVSHPDQGPINPVALTVELSPGMPLARLDSRYHPIRIEQSGADEQPRFHVALGAGPVAADRDFELVWTPEPGHAPRAALFTEEHDGETYALLMLSPPAADALEQQRTPRDLSFVIDVSGSMHGASIEQARKALVHALQRLDAHDRFNVIAFNNRAWRLFPALSAATGDRVAQAVAWVNALQADGGTEMAGALTLALPASGAERGSAAERLHQVIFMTDGAVGNEAALFKLIAERLGHSRLFPVGIGAAPNSHFMRKAATFGRGSFTYIGDPSEVMERMDVLLRRLEYPALTGLALDLGPQGDLAEDGRAAIYPNPLPDLYLGEPVQVALRLPLLPDSLRVSGRFGKRPWQAELALDQPLPGDGMRVTWARRRIASLMDELYQGGDPQTRATLQEQITATALQHHLVSRYTSLVAVDQSPARPPGDALDTQALKTNLPQGWTYEKVFGSRPLAFAQGATPATLQLTAGLALLLGAAMARVLRRRRGRR